MCGARGRLGPSCSSQSRGAAQGDRRSGDSSSCVLSLSESDTRDSPPSLRLRGPGPTLPVLRYAAVLIPDGISAIRSTASPSELWHVGSIATALEEAGCLSTRRGRLPGRAQTTAWALAESLQA